VKGVLIAVLVIAVIAGGLLALRSSRNLGMPSNEVLKRAAKRKRERTDEDER
jgi:Tfp pilus assembly protein PilV